MKFAWLCSHESYQPEDLVRQAIAAEEAGFDFIIASEKARFAVPEIDVGAMGGSRHARRILPPMMMRYLVMTAERVDGHFMKAHGAALGDDGTLYVHDNRHDGTFDTASWGTATTSHGGAWETLVGDFPGDCFTDYADHDLASGRFFVHENRTDGTFAPTSPVVVVVSLVHRFKSL